MQFPFEVNSGLTYDSYVELLNQYVEEGRTSGPIQSESLIDYTVLNAARIKRLNKRFKLQDSSVKKLENLSTPQRWVVISEFWCGDAAQTLPVMNVIAEASKHIQLEIIFRDENLPIIDSFLTNGKRSIPKLIAMDSDNNVLFTWGPQPKSALALKKEYDLKTEPGSKEAFKKELHTWYAKDIGLETEAEIIACL